MLWIDLWLIHGKAVDKMCKSLTLASQIALRGIWRGFNIQENYEDIIFHKKFQYYRMMIHK